MAEVQIISKLGIVKKKFESDIDPTNARAALELLRAQGHPEGSIKVKQKRGGWRTFRDR